MVIALTPFLSFRIRIREKLNKLSRRPEIFNRRQVDEITFSSIDRLMQLKRCPDLKSAKAYNIFPTAESLEMLDLLYGDAISRVDIDGAEYDKNRKKSHDMINKGADEDSQSLEEYLDTKNQNDNLYQNRTTRSKRVPALDCKNIEYEEYLKTRPQHRINYLAEQQELKHKAWEEMLFRQYENDKKCTEVLQNSLTNLHETFPHVHQMKVYNYSTQSLNYQTLAVNELKRQLSGMKNVAFTFNKNFSSQNFNTYDIRHINEKDLWLTKSGFQYPKSKTIQELIQHPNKPSMARIMDLQQPWEENRITLASLTAPDATLNEDQRLREKEFNLRFKAEETFGYLNPPEYARSFELKNIGDKSHLPRGRMITKKTDKDPDFFRSVHLFGDEAQKILEQARTQEIEEWKSRVIVDTTDFKVGGYSVRDTPIQIDRQKDILHDEPKRNALKYLRIKTSSSGQSHHYETTPVSIFTINEPYVPNALDKMLRRQFDESKFITTATMGDDDIRPQDFTRYIHKDTKTLPFIKATSSRLHRPLDEDRFKDEYKPKAKWEYVSSFS
jgi:hypothetical protein